MNLKIPPVLVFSICVALAWLTKFVASSFSYFSVLNDTVGYAFITIGFIIGLSGVIEFLKHKTTVDPTAPSKTKTIVSSGIYKFTRNPMYLGMAIGLFGIITFLGNALSLLTLVIFIWYMTQFQIKPEEEALKLKFGEAYLIYLKKVRRWI